MNNIHLMRSFFSSRSQPPKRRWLRLVINLAVPLGFLLLLQAWQGRATLRGLAPDIGGLTTSGQSLHLSDFRGGPVALHFWGSWCGVCRAEQPTIVAFSANHPVVTVAAYSGSREEVASYLTEHPIGAPTLVDPSGTLARRFGVTSYPTTFVLDEEGRIQYTSLGFSSELGLRFRMWLAGL